VLRQHPGWPARARRPAWPSPTESGLGDRLSGGAHAISQPLEVGLTHRQSGFGCHACQPQPAQREPILIPTDLRADILAVRTVAALSHLFVYERLQGVEQGDVHGAHARKLCFWQILAKRINLKPPGLMSRFRDRLSTPPLQNHHVWIHHQTIGSPL